MKFFLMRHGEAETFAASDMQRNLTERGRLHVSDHVRHLSPQLSDVDCIIHSPYLRTCQTANIVADILSVTDLIESDQWTPDSSPVIALQSLEELENRCPIVVTHMPIVSRVEALCCDDERFPHPFQCGELTQIIAEWPAAGLGKHRRLV